MFQYRKEGSVKEYLCPFYFYIPRNQTCKEVSKGLKAKFHSKVEVKRASVTSITGSSFQITNLTRLEEDDKVFYEKYSKKHLVVEHCSSTEENGLKLINS